jgi:hypothetical protein
MPRWQDKSDKIIRFKIRYPCARGFQESLSAEPRQHANTCLRSTTSKIPIVLLGRIVLVRPRENSNMLAIISSSTSHGQHVISTPSTCCFARCYWLTVWKLMKKHFWQQRLPLSFVIGLVCVLLGAGGSILYLCFGMPSPSPAQLNKPSVLPLGSYLKSPLSIGQRSPALTASGWINGPPQQPGTPGSKLILLDIWAHW